MKKSLDAKIKYTKSLIDCWVESWDGTNNVVISFSGGKDSSVLLHIARDLYPDIPAVFSNTGLEHPSIVQVVHGTPNVQIVRPKKPFHVVVKQYGWPVISKTVARFVNDCQNATDKNRNTVTLRKTGRTSTGRICKSQQLSKKWFFLIDAPFKISDRCCYYLKKRPLERFYKMSQLRPMVGIRKVESNRRDKLIKQLGCNMYDIKKPISYPLANWTEQDIWAYIKKYKVPYATAYDEGETRTGCVFCMFGIMYDKTRFVRLHTSSPKQWDFVINKMKGKEVLDYINIPY